MHPLEYFQRIYIINLAHRVDRRREMDAQLQKIGLSLNHPLVQLFEAVRPDNAGGFPSIGARGCFLSHLYILQQAREQKLERVLILEDDLNFVNDFATRIATLVGELRQRNWGMFYGGYRATEDGSAESGAGLSSVPPQQGIQTTHFVALQQPAIAQAVPFLEAMLARQPGDPNGGPMHVDGAYSWFRNACQELPTLVATPQLGYQRSSKTDVHNLRWFDRTPIVSLGVAALRQLRNRITNN